MPRKHLERCLPDEKQALPSILGAKRAIFGGFDQLWRSEDVSLIAARCFHRSATAARIHLGQFPLKQPSSDCAAIKPLANDSEWPLAANFSRKNASNGAFSRLGRSLSGISERYHACDRRCMEKRDYFAWKPAFFSPTGGASEAGGVTFILRRLLILPD